MSLLIPSSWLLLVLFFLGACSLNGSSREWEEKSHSDSSQTDMARVPNGSSPQENSDIERLAHLWQKRVRHGIAGDYPMGPGDVIDISVPAMEELRGHTVRVLGDGTISLPFLGKIQAAGLTEEELREKIRERVERYMYHPRIITFVREYRNRQVAVLGAVLRPGLYSLKSEADTILDVISQAGGISPAADPRIHLIPAEPTDGDEVKKVVATLPEGFLMQDPAPLILKRTDPILIDLKEAAYGGYQKYLSLPVRPGDVIMVPGGGQVLVQGWVEKPGAYSISPGLTVSGVVAAAGGPVFAANTSAIKIIRTKKGGGKAVFLADLEKIKNGEQADMPLQGGDFIEVVSSPERLVVYGLYRFFSTAINVGIGGNIPLW